ncbi:MAG TPA: hypothetical protein VGB05_10710 [Pyrinomonadaceae bacterium]|jgi:hypothetical protein
MSRNEFTANADLAATPRSLPAPRSLPVRRMTPAVLYVYGARPAYWSALALSALAFIVR